MTPSIPSNVSILVIHLVYGVPLLVQLLVVQLGEGLGSGDSLVDLLHHLIVRHDACLNSLL